MTTVAMDARVTGQVQGVSFRMYAAQQAGRLGVAGWIRNEPDGSVAGHFEGSSDAVDAMVDWCRAGPSYARVERVTVEPSNVEGLASFDIRD
jgi:acylphosphatase